MTATKGLFAASAIALPVVSPTITPPIRPGPGGGGDGVEIVHAAAGLIKRAADQLVEHFDMRARGDFRHHAAIGRMFGDLAEHSVGQDLAAPVESVSTTAAAVSSQVLSMPRTRKPARIE